MLPTLMNFHFSLAQIPVSAMAVSEIMLRYCNSDDKINYNTFLCVAKANPVLVLKYKLGVVTIGS